MSKNFFDRPFDEGTKIKLEIFKKYLASWLPTFTKGKEIYWKNIFIYDLFAGPGRDVDGNNGSPLIIIEELKRHYSAIRENNLTINVVFNDLNKNNIVQLENEINQAASKRPYNIQFYNEDFYNLFNKLYPSMLKNRSFPILLFFDQYGIKYVTKEIILKVIELKRADLLFFISSSYVKRFSELDEFRAYLKIQKEEFNEARPFHSHRIVFQYFKSMINENKKYFLAPFSIKKGKNIYGLIFGSNHSFGIEKFLNVVWKLNPNTGDANFNIDEERIAEGELSLFEEENKPKKLQLFEKELRANILNGNINFKDEIYSFTFNFGCLPKHANTVVKKLIEEKRIDKLMLSAGKIHKLENEKIKVFK